MPDLYEGLEAHLDAIPESTEEALPSGAPPAEKPLEPPAVEAPKSEDKPAETPAAEKPSAYAERFLKLTREERQTREKQQHLEQKETEINAAEPELVFAREVAEALKDPKKALALMNKHGLTLRQLNDARVAEIESEKDGGNPATGATPNDELVKKLARVEEELTSLKTERQREREDAVLTKFDSEVRHVIQSPDFELVQAEGEEGVDLVKEIVKQHLAASKKLIEYKEAARLAEAHFERKAEKLAATNKVKSRFAPKPAPDPDEEEPATLSGSAVTRGAIGSENKQAAEESFEQFLARKFG